MIIILARRLLELRALYDGDIYRYNSHCLCVSSIHQPGTQDLEVGAIFWLSLYDKFSVKIPYSSHCSDQSGVSLFSLTDVWNFSFPRPIVTNASFVPGIMNVIAVCWLEPNHLESRGSLVVCSCYICSSAASSI